MSINGWQFQIGFNAWYSVLALYNINNYLSDSNAILRLRSEIDIHRSILSWVLDYICVDRRRALVRFHSRSLYFWMLLTVSQNAKKQTLTFNCGWKNVSTLKIKNGKLEWRKKGEYDIDFHMYTDVLLNQLARAGGILWLFSMCERQVKIKCRLSGMCEARYAVFHSSKCHFV